VQGQYLDVELGCEFFTLPKIQHPNIESNILKCGSIFILHSSFSFHVVDIGSQAPETVITHTGGCLARHGIHQETQGIFYSLHSLTSGFPEFSV